MRRRINVTLPADTIRLMDRVSKKGNRSRLIDQAVRHCIKTIGGSNLEKRLKEGARKRAERDLGIAHAWFSLGENGW
jgi:metal-responsive CopG/Arc/MetJ family transcriptional regulator